MKILREGYRIPFFESPPESFSKNDISALRNMEFVEEAVIELLKSNRVVQTPFKPWIVSPLSVSTNKLGKKRLILDLRILILDIMRQSACLVLNPITVYSYGFLFNCTTVVQASDSMTALT